MNKQTIDHFLTISTAFTYFGASIGVMAVSNTIRALTSRNSPWIPFIVAVIISVGGAYALKDHPTFADVGIALINACILFTSSAGIQQGFVVKRPRKDVGGDEAFSKKSVPWRSAWFG